MTLVGTMMSEMVFSMLEMERILTPNENPKVLYTMLPTPINCLLIKNIFIILNPI